MLCRKGQDLDQFLLVFISFVNFWRLVSLLQGISRYKEQIRLQETKKKQKKIGDEGAYLEFKDGCVFYI